MLEKIQLSPSKLSVLRECEACFWDQEVLKKPRPRGIFPSLPGGMDIVFKKYFDGCRPKLPYFLQNEIFGSLLPDQQLLRRWRFWKTALKYENDDVRLVGALDECLVYDGCYIPLDYKTKGSEPKDDGSQYYQTQLDCYNLILDYNSYKVSDTAYLVYFYPKDIIDPDEFNQDFGCVPIRFKSKVYKILCSRERAKEVLKHAVNIIRMEKRPQSDIDCEYCKLKGMNNEQNN